MIVLFDKSFTKSLRKIKDKTIKRRIVGFISLMKTSEHIHEVSSVKKIKGFKNYYRYRFGDYRIGIRQVSPTTIKLIVIAKRSDIYKLFP